MKKILLITSLTLLILAFVKKEEYVIVPEESIRFRVIAASDDEYDIEIKEQLAQNITHNLSDVFSYQTLEESRKNIANNIEKVESEIEKTFKEKNYKKNYSVDYGINYFPEKIYKGVKYNSGYYESLVITIDEGKGSNYWCVMFPPLCMIDESVPREEREYSLKVLEIIEKFKSINKQ